MVFDFSCRVCNAMAALFELILLDDVQEKLQLCKLLTENNELQSPRFWFCLPLLLPADILYTSVV